MSSMNSYINSFDAAHGGLENAPCYQSKYYFPDGAVRHGQDMRTPTGLEKLENIAFHHKLLLDDEVAAFHRLKERLSNDEHGWSKRDEHLARLKELQAAVRKRQKMLEKAELEVEKNTPGYIPPEIRKQQAAALAQTEALRSSFWAEVEKIEV